SWLERGFRWIHRLAPRTACVPGEDDALATFMEGCRAAHAHHGTPGLWRHALAEYWDLTRCVIRLRLGRDPGRIQSRTADRRASRHARRGGSRMVDDLKHALKRLRARTSTTLIAVTTLSLAIGISVAMFTVVDALIL